MIPLRVLFVHASARAQGHAWAFADGCTSWSWHHPACGCPNSSRAGTRPRG